MKWVKHMTATWDDEKIARLVKAGGIEGLAAYGLWWRVLEIVAGQMDAQSPNCSVTYDVTRWSLLLSLRGSHVRHWLEKLAVTTLLTAEWAGTEVKVTIPKLLKYRDEYSKKSGHSRNKEVEGEGDTDREQKDQHLCTPAAAVAPPPNSDPPPPVPAEAKTPVAIDKAKRPQRGTRFTEETIPSEWAEWCAVDLGWETLRTQATFLTFRDYWRPKTRDALKLDWLATWRNWCREEVRRESRGRAGPLFANSPPARRPRNSDVLDEAIEGRL